MKVEKTTLTKDPAVIVEDFVRDPKSFASRAGDAQESACRIQVQQTLKGFEILPNSTGPLKAPYCTLQALSHGAQHCDQQFSRSSYSHAASLLG